MPDENWSDAPSGFPEPGELFDGRFRIEGLLGEGGMGIVLSATHELMETPVAIKMLHPELVDQPASVARFLREARNAAAVRSEHVGQVLDVARTPDGLPYIVMELIPGTDLSVVCSERGRLSVEEAATYILQTCVAVAEAHAAGIVHRDLKPSNLLLARRADGSPLVKVFDFGISKQRGENREETQTLTKTGVALGTPSYMAPEQISDAKSADERADVWSLGAMLYEMLAGRLPFVGDTVAAVMAAVTSGKYPPLDSLRPELPPAMVELVHGCLQKDRDKRLPDVAALAKGLVAFVSPEHTPLSLRVERTRRSPTPTPVRDSAPRRRDASPDSTTVLVTPPDAPSKPRPGSSTAPLSPPQSPRRPAVATPPRSSSKSRVAATERSADRKRPEPAPEPVSDHGRRAYALTLYIAVVVTLIALSRLIPSGDTAAPGGTAAAVTAAAPPAGSAPAAPAASTSKAVESVPPAATQAPSATASASAIASSAPVPRGSATAPVKPKLPEDFVDQP